VQLAADPQNSTEDFASASAIPEVISPAIAKNKTGAIEGFQEYLIASLAQVRLS
jgi:hypothetical protein